VVQPAIQLENRSSTITVGTVSISNVGQQIGLDIWFSVRRSLRPKEPNTCDLKLYNLSDASRKAIEAASQPSPGPAQPGGTNTIVPVKVVAGYVGGTSTIFLGELRSAQTTTDGASSTTELQTGDSDNAAIMSRITQSFGAGANAYVVAQALLSAMKVGQGNIQTVADILRSAAVYNKGTILKGNALAAMVDLATSCGLEFSLQQGVPQFLSLGQPTGGQAYLLNSNSGLIGSPALDTKGTLSCQTLMLPGLRPGCPIQMQSEYVTGLYRVISIETTGDTSGNDWNHNIEARRYGTGLG
jgi:hypothetical protein